MPDIHETSVSLDELDSKIAAFRIRHAEMARLAVEQSSGMAGSAEAAVLLELAGRLRQRLASIAALTRSLRRRALSKPEEANMAAADFTLRFTVDGKYVGDPIDPPLDWRRPVNDVHFEFRRGKLKPKMAFTRDGNVVPDGSKEAPDDAIGVGVEFGDDASGTPVVRFMHWSRLDPETGAPAPFGFEWAPDGTNDFHLELGEDGLITKAWWTHDGRKHPKDDDIEIPNYPVNDVHLVRGHRRQASIDYRQLAGAVLATIGRHSGSALARQAKDANGPGRVPDEWLRLVIRYLYETREGLAKLDEEFTKSHLRPHLRELRQQVQDSETLRPEEKADLIRMIDAVLELLG